MQLFAACKYQVNVMQHVLKFSTSVKNFFAGSHFGAQKNRIKIQNGYILILMSNKNIKVIPFLIDLNNINF